MIRDVTHAGTEASSLAGATRASSFFSSAAAGADDDDELSSRAFSKAALKSPASAKRQETSTVGSARLLQTVSDALAALLRVSSGLTFGVGESDGERLLGGLSVRHVGLDVPDPRSVGSNVRGKVHLARD